MRRQESLCLTVSYAAQLLDTCHSRVRCTGLDSGSMLPFRARGQGFLEVTYDTLELPVPHTCDRMLHRDLRLHSHVRMMTPRCLNTVGGSAAGAVNTLTVSVQDRDGNEDPGMCRCHDSVGQRIRLE